MNISALANYATIGPVGGGPRGAQKSEEEPKPGRVIGALPSAVVDGMSATLATIASNSITWTSPSTPLSLSTGFAGVVQAVAGVGEILYGYEASFDFDPARLRGKSTMVAGFGDLIMGVGLIAAANGLGYPAMIPIVGGAAINLVGAFSR